MLLYDGTTKASEFNQFQLKVESNAEERCVVSRKYRETNHLALKLVLRVYAAFHLFPSEYFSRFPVFFQLPEVDN
jgi:hypothetical protein